MRNNNKKTEETKRYDWDVSVESAKEVKEGRARFNLIINGIKVYGCWLIEYTKKDTGEEAVMITFPQYKGSDDKYHDIVWAPLDTETKQKIINQVYSLLG